MIEVKLPDGAVARFPDGTPKETITAALRKKFGGPKAATEPPAAPATGFREQAMSGVNEGIADILGAPVDIITGAINGGAGLVNGAFGTEIPAIQEPFGGSATMRGLLSPTISETPPQTAPQRYGRSIGHELGASVPALGVMGKASSLAAALAPAAVSAAGAGVGSQVARDMLPSSEAAAAIGGLIGGMAPVGLTYALRAGPQKPPSVTDLKREAGTIYEAGKARPAAPAQAVDDLSVMVTDELKAMDRITPTGRVQASGDVRSFLDVVEDYSGQSMSPQAMQNARTYLQDAAKSTDAGERRVASILLDRFDEWRGQQVPEFAEADAIYGRAKRAEMVEALVEKGERRAATSGTGGNSVNAIRQNLRGILDDPRKSRGFSEVERAAMEAVVRGDGLTNALRTVGRLSPTSGALPLMANIAGTAINTPAGLTMMAAGAGAKALAEGRTASQVTALSEALRNGGPVSRKTLTEVERLVLQTALARALAIGGAQ